MQAASPRLWGGIQCSPQSHGTTPVSPLYSHFSTFIFLMQLELTCHSLHVCRWYQMTVGPFNKLILPSDDEGHCHRVFSHCSGDDGRIGCVVMCPGGGRENCSWSQARQRGFPPRAAHSALGTRQVKSVVRERSEGYS